MKNIIGILGILNIVLGLVGTQCSTNNESIIFSLSICLIGFFVTLVAYSIKNTKIEQKSCLTRIKHVETLEYIDIIEIDGNEYVTNSNGGIYPLPKKN